jgi:predicted MPP superfamily phosphohydrolase
VGGDIMLTMMIIPMVVVLTSAVYCAYKNTKKMMVNKIHLFERDSYSSFASLHVLQISDMHLEKISITPEQLYHELKNEKIDLIALTGDYLDKKKSIPKLIPYLKVFNQLNPKYGVYVVFGNHDYRLKQQDFEALCKTFQQYGCKLLKNQSETIYVEGKPINIIGIDDFYTNKSDVKQSFVNVKKGYRLVLTHDPSIVLQMKDVKFDYLLSGHFHGGQIHWPKPFHLSKMSKEMVRMNMIKGLHYYNGKPFYISEGLGQTSLNIRIGSRPEITLHHIPFNIENVEASKILAVI